VRKESERRDEEERGIEWSWRGDKRVEGREESEVEWNRIGIGEERKRREEK
jgi:hypothetical protein